MAATGVAARWSLFSLRDGYFQDVKMLELRFVVKRA